MTDVSIAVENTVHSEDISVGASGTAIITRPCTIWDMTVSIEGAVTAIVNFSNNSDGYNATYRIKKVVVNGPQTIHLTFPKGWYLSTGLSAVANNGSVDVDVTYD